MRRDANPAHVERTKARKQRRLAKKFKEMERKRLRENITRFHYEIIDNNIVKVKEEIS